jgi:hypothetical protein
MSLKVIKPVTLTDAMLASSTAVETVAAWSSTTTYALGAEARQGTRIYVSKVAGNTGNPPATSAAQWLDDRADNAHMMFDDSISTQTVATNSLTVVLQPGIINSMGLFGLTGSSATVSVRDGAAGPVVYSASIELDGSIITDWYQYFFESFDQRREWFLTDLPPYGSAHITITVTGGGEVGVGNLILGTVYELGEVLSGARLATDDYSRVEFDQFGTASLSRRKSSKRTTLPVLTPRAKYGKAAQILDDLRATPAVWIPSQRDADRALAVFGIRSSWDIAVEYDTQVLLSIELKGMT